MAAPTSATAAEPAPSATAATSAPPVSAQTWASSHGLPARTWLTPGTEAPTTRQAPACRVMSLLPPVHRRQRDLVARVGVGHLLRAPRQPDEHVHEAQPLQPEQPARG